MRLSIIELRKKKRRAEKLSRFKITADNSVHDKIYIGFVLLFFSDFNLVLVLETLIVIVTHIPCLF